MIHKLYQSFLQSTGVSTDTRSIEEGNIWFALKGPNFNANKFAKQALEKGASLAVIDDPEYALGANTWLVKDGLAALQQLANYHRKQLDIPFLAITGSNGKTTTKELVRDVLAKKFKVLATKGNFNNHIGVPLTLLQIDKAVEFAVIEMGANAQEEIKWLCEIAAPDYGLITNIGKAHLEGFGGLEGVFKGKTEMYDYLAKNEGRAFVNTNNPRLVDKLNELNIPFVSYPNQGDDFRASLLSEQPQLLIEAFEETFETSIIGAYNFENICAALCVGQYFGVSPEDAMAAVAAYDPDNNRSQVIAVGGNKVILDAYNANPSSMAEAIQSFARRKAERKVLILGDMLELGEKAGQEHFALGELTKQFNFDEVHFCGPLMKAAFEANPNAKYWTDKQQLSEFLTSRDGLEATWLIKGSRGMSLESLVKVIKK